MTEFAKTFRLSDFGLIGYGYDAINARPRVSVTEFTYNDPAKIKIWRDKRIAFPDQAIVSDTQKGSLSEGIFTGCMTSARDYQRRLGASLGLEMTDPETDMTLCAAAKATNALFRQTDSKIAQSAYDAAYNFSYFGMTFNIEQCFRSDVAEAARDCRSDPNLIACFFDTYGTHVLTGGDIGGHMTVQTFVRLNAQTAKEVSKNGLDISAEVRMEDDDYAEGGLKFSERDKRTSSLFRSVSSRKIDLIGGNINAMSFEDWSASLRESAIPTNVLAPGTRHVATPRAVGLAGTGSEGSQSLGLINLRFSAFPDLLRLAGIIDGAAATTWHAALRKYLSGRNPFENTPQRLAPDMTDTAPLRPGQSNTYELRGWMATYVTYAGLIGLPGARAVVTCDNDHSIGETSKTVYAGERIMLRGKTPYLASQLFVRFDAALGDPDARLLSENRLVGWFEEPDD